jgi:ribonucleoside-triphosphate reductase
MVLSQIRKRDGKIVLFNKEKITNAIFKAASSVGGTDKELAKKLADKVIEILESKYDDNNIPNVEHVQDIVEKILIEEGHAKTAKAYILYREKRRQVRETKHTLLDIEQTMDEYLQRSDWRVNENANVDFSLGGLILYISGKITANYWLNHIYNKEIRDAHVGGDFHIHDLSMFSGYCAGWSLRQLIVEGFGGVPNRLETVPAKHFDTIMGQMVNFLGTLQNEWAGAQAFSSFDSYLSAFVKHDKMDYKQVKQQMQRFMFNIATPSRWGTQCVPIDTEALTDKGWKKYNEIKRTDKIATFNIKNKKIEYLKPLHIKSYNFDGYLINLKNRTQDQLVTPDHKIVRKKFNSNKFELIEAEKLFNFKTKIQIPNSAETKSKKEINKNLVELIAWLVSEGSFSDGSRNEVYIFQSVKNKKNCDKIRKCLRNLGYKWDESLKEGGFSKIKTVRFRLNQESSRKIRKYINKKKIPGIIKTLSKKQIRLFLDTYILGEGSREEKGRIKIYTKDKEVRDSIQELCVLCGYGSSVNKRANGVYVINLVRNNITNITKITRKKFKGKVWCPTTRNGTFVARRNDKVFITGNTPFINTTLDWMIPEDLKDKPAIVGGKEQSYTYGDCQEEADMINKAFMECMIEGDASKRIFTFPIPTYNVTKDFDWDSENADLLFEMTGKYGIPYFQNFINSSLKPSDVRSMCCRLQLDLRELKNKTGGLFGAGENTGSIGVVTINMPRIGYLANTEEEFLDRLYYLMRIAKQSLEIKRKVISKKMGQGLLPYTKRYLGSLNHHFSTIGLNGMNEACLNLFGENIATTKGRNFAIRVLEFMRDKLTEFQEETKNIYNLEATPAEGTSYRLAKIDKNKFPDIITAGKNEPYYTNSTSLPVNYTDDFFEALELQDELQTKYTGGTVLHCFLGERLNDVESTKKLVRRIAYNFRLPYYTLTPTFSVCQQHGYLRGEHNNCPKCNMPTEVYSRVVGFLRPVSTWNKGKREEFFERKTFNYEKSMKHQISEETLKRIKTQTTFD